MTLAAAIVRGCRPLVQVVCALLLASALVTRAWDADLMLRAAQAHGAGALGSAAELRALIGGLADQSDAAKLVGVNRFFNERITFASDIEVWGEVDHWASPLELLAKGRGDCEDYVIGKYFSLLATGIPVGRLRLVYVNAQLGGAQGETMAHMVLAHYAAPDAEPSILDNLIGEIRPASKRPDLMPVFSFNGEGLWHGVGGQAAGNPVARLSRWREVLAKARATGFQ